MKRLILALALAVPFAVSAAGDDLNCSIKAKKLTSKKDMMAMAKVSDADARKAAMSSVGAGSTISKGGLEVEDGCLIYDFDVKVAGKTGIEEVTIDAGTGKVLKSAHEGAMSEAAGKVKQKAVDVKDKVKTEAKEVKDKVTGRPPGTDK
jgi:uncharacterized membrane protein YkoI